MGNGLLTVYGVASGIVSPLGWTAEENFQHVVQGESRLRRWEGVFGLPEPCFISLIDNVMLAERFEQLSKDDSQRFTKVEQMAILAAVQAIGRAGIDAASPDVLFVLSTTKGNVDLLEHNPYEPQRVYLWRTAQLVAEFFHNPNVPVVVSNACISGCAAQLAAVNFLRSGLYRHVVVIGAETLSKFVISGFQSFKALSVERCKPFDAQRIGLNLGEAAAAIVYAAADSVAAVPEGALLFQNGSVNNDANHISGPSRTAEGLLRSIAKTLQAFDTKRIAFINAHGTATVYNDDMESVGIHRAGLQELPVNSLKGYYGHTLGAAGVLETILSCYALRNGMVLGSKGTETPGTVQPLQVPLTARTVQGDSFMKLISGFGGSNAAMLFTIKHKSNE